MKFATLALAAGLAVLAAVTLIPTGTSQTEAGATNGSNINPSLLKELQALQQKPLAVYPFDRVMGSPAAPVTIIEYASLTCTHCADFHQKTLPQIERDWIRTGKAKYVLRDLPWDNLAFAMAKVSRCGDNTNYFNIVKALFKNQEDILTAGDSPQIIAAIAKTVEPFGFSRSQTESCINGEPNLHATVAAMRDSALKSLGVRGTPTTYIDGTAVDGAEEYAKVKPLLEKAYAARTGAQ